MAIPAPERSIPEALPATRCPLCGEANLCAMAAPPASGVEPAPCWCAEVDFSAELLARVPAPARRKACICRRCATAS